MSISGQEVWRDFESDGIPSSGSHNPRKSDIRMWSNWVERIISAFLNSGGLIYASKVLLDADLAHAANSMAWVIGDGTPSNNGIYMKVGASGAGSWSRVADLPYSFIIAEDEGDGTPNAIQATSSLPVVGSALVLLNIFEANTASPVTVSFNGGTPLTIKSNSGNDITPSGLQSGMVVLGRVSGSTFRLVSDQVSAAIIAQAEDILLQVEDIRDLVIGSVPNVFPPTRSAMKALDTSTVTAAYLKENGRSGQFFFVSGDFVDEIANDPQEAIYVKADAVAASVGAWVRAVFDVLNLKWFGAVGDGVVSDQVATQAAVNLAISLGKVLHAPSTTASYRLTDTINITGSLKLFGDGVDPGANYGPNEGTNAAGVVTRGAGSWFFLDHTGVGFRAISAAASIMGIEYRRIGTYRTQPTPGAGFTPTNHDYDFSGAGVDVLYEDIMLLNATRGIHQDVAANAYTYGRITCKRVRGQPLLSGIRIHNCYDACRLEDIHFWPFWSHNLGVWTYTKANLIAIDSGRNDNPILTNIFSIFHRIGINVYSSPNGGTFRLQGMNLDIERGGYALVVDPAVVGFTAHLTNVVFQGEQGQVGNTGIYLRGTNNVIDIVNAEIFDFGASGVIVQGSGNMINFDHLTLNTWGLQGTGHFGIFADAGNTVTIDGRIYGGATTGNGPLLGGTGAIRYPGLVTSGTVNITSAATSVVVSHGLPLTPPREKIQLTMLSGLGTGGGFWVSASTSTTFTIQLNAAPGATITLGWRACLE